MVVSYCGSNFNIPDLLIEKYIDDFKDLPGSAERESVYMLRDSIGEMMDVVAEEPEILEEPDCMTDFIAALAMRKALEVHGILYDA